MNKQKLLILFTTLLGVTSSFCMEYDVAFQEQEEQEQVLKDSLNNPHRAQDIESTIWFQDEDDRPGDSSKGKATTSSDHRAIKKIKEELSPEEDCHETREYMLPWELWQHIFYLLYCRPYLNLGDNIYKEFLIVKASVLTDYQSVSLTNREFRSTSVPLISCIRNYYQNHLRFLLELNSVDAENSLAGHQENGNDNEDEENFGESVREDENEHKECSYFLRATKIILSENARVKWNKILADSDKYLIQPRYFLASLELLLFFDIPAEGALIYVIQNEKFCEEYKLQLMKFFLHYQQPFELLDGTIINIRSGVNMSLLIMVLENSTNMQSSLGFVKLLLEYGADINQLVGKKKYLPLHFAVSTLDNSDEESCKIIRLLLEYGANINAYNEINGHTPLHTTLTRPLTSPDQNQNGTQNFRRGCRNPHATISPALWDRSLMLRTLLDNAADVNLPTLKTGYTSLHLAILNRAHKNILKLLIDHGADPYIRNKKGVSSIGFAQTQSSDRYLYKKLIKWHVDYLRIASEKD